MNWYNELPKWGKEAIDQTIHFTAGFTISAIAGLIIGIIVGLLREGFQNWGDEDNDYVDMAIDLSVWCLGVLASLAF